MVTAGPTCEDLDPVRYLTNRSSGKMGYAVAQAAARRGAKVILVSGPTALETPAGVRRVDVRTAEQMHEAVTKEFAACSIGIFAAAVADYRPAEKHAEKIKKKRWQFDGAFGTDRGYLAGDGQREGRQIYRWICGGDH